MALTLGPGLTIRGRGNVYSNFGTTGSKVVGLGAPMRADISGSTLTLNTFEWQANSGLQAVNGGTLALTGTLMAASQTLTLNSSAGTISLAGGVLVGGLLTGGELKVLNGSSGTLSGAVTMLGSGTVTVVGGASGSTLYFQNGASLIGSGAVVLGESSSMANLRIPTNGSTGTLGAGITVRGRGSVNGNFGTTGSRFVSLGGPFRADVGGSALTLSDVEWQGDGSWETASGGVLSLSGTLTATGHSLSVLPSGGAVTLSGTLVGGTLTGGTLVTTSGALNGVTLATTLDAPGATAVATILNGLTLNGGVIQLSGANSILYFNGTQTVGGTGEIVMSGASPSLRPVTNSSTLTVGQGLTVHGRGNVYGNFGTLGSKIVSLGGPFRGDVSGSALTLSDVEWQGDGSWETASGGVLTLSGALTATGHSLSVLPSGGAVTLSGTLVGGTLTGGTLVTTSGALDGVTLATTLDAPGATALATILNGLTLNGGVIQLSGANSILYFNGTQTIGGTGEIVMSGTSPSLRPVTNSSTLTLGPGLTIRGRGNVYSNFGTTGSSIVNQGVLRANLSGATLGLSGGGWQNNGLFHSTGGATLAISGGWSTSGMVQVDTSSALTSSAAYAQTGAGAVTLLNGGSVTASGAMNIQSGTLRGFGSITGSVTNSGVLEPGVGAGQLAIVGPYTQAAGGACTVEIGGTTAGTQYDQLLITGAFTRGGTLNVTTINGFAPTLGQSFSIVTHPSASGVFAVVNSCVGGGLGYAPMYSATTTRLDVAPAPCP